MSLKHFHFSGICGTAMASVAVLLKKRGHKITGSDQNVYPPMSDFLKANEIEIQSPYHEDNLKPHPDVVVLGNVLSRGNPEVEYALEAHLHYISIAELLKNEFIRGNRSIVITGTHGKTSVTSLTAQVFDHCKKPAGFMIGGIPENFGTSSRDVEKGGYFIIEGDEYDTSLFDKRSKFFHYLPDLLVINNIEFDHADIFKDIDDIKKSFILMLRQIPQNGLIIVNGDDSVALEVAKSGYSPYVTFGFSDKCDAVISNVKAIAGKLGMSFDLDYKENKGNWEIPILGEFNVRNATAVILLAIHEGLPLEQVQEALLNYKNVKRRLQQLTSNQYVRVFDDFAHHPTAIKETINALRTAWPDSRIHAIFEARSNTAVRNIHQETLGAAFANADTITISKLHRLETIDPDERLDVNKIISELTEQGKTAQQLESFDDIVEYCIAEAQPNDIFVMMSNGGFGGVPHLLAEALDNKW
ncbi:MAG: UDP-N-acetylmuramate:L-alanyl-gamma-D-glutamyl-meso-diaminopimelate ligase [Proteobacteria bacterium]|nr:UDP-N-acetylmuramate:L-alanyl-gamma-D-glutamyl-meso-diaminopimelate ligase [Pseudomonadota bacterium]